MNIAVLHFHRIGGSGIVAYEIAKQMTRRGHCVHFVGLEKPFRMINEKPDMVGTQCMHFHKVTMVEYPVFDYQPYVLALASQLAEIILAHDIDVIHSHYAIPHAVAAILAKKISEKKVRCITTLHGTDITIVGATPSMYKVTQYSIDKSDYVTTVSNFLKQQTCSTFHSSSHHIEVLYNFIDEELLNEPFTPKPLVQEVIFLHASNLRSIKDPLEVVELFYHVLTSVDDENVRNNYYLWVVGEGPLKYAMIERVKELGIQNQVKFWGEYNDINIFIRQSSFFLFPSKGESFGLAALEAMAYGVPTIGLRMGGLVEVIDDNVDGILYEDGKTIDAVSRVVELIKIRSKYRAMSQAAYNKVRNKFLSKPIIDRYEEIYQGNY